MSVQLTRPSRMTTISYRLEGAPDFETTKGGYLVRPTHCKVKWFSGAIGKIEVTGNVVSRRTGMVGNRLISETFMIHAAAEGEDVKPEQAYDGPAFVVEVFRAAAALGESA